MLLVSNLSKNATIEILTEIFRIFGKISLVEIPLDEKNNNLFLSVAFVSYEDEGDADQALQFMNHGTCDGKIIKCERIAPEQKKYEIIESLFLLFRKLIEDIK
jgi:RNA-binding protein with serine-rich domain 1